MERGDVEPPGGDARHEFGLVADHDDRLVGPPRLQELQQQPDAGGVEVVGRFVQQDQLRGRGQASPDAEQLELPAGEAVDPECAQVAQAFGEFGVLGVPALVINGRIVCVGTVPDRNRIRQWLMDLKASGECGKSG